MSQEDGEDNQGIIELSDDKKKKKIIALGDENQSKRSRKDAEAYYKEKFKTIVGKDHAKSLLEEYSKISNNTHGLPVIKLMEEQNAFIISIYKTYPEIPTRCFMTIFGIGSNRLSNFIKKGILTRKKPGGLNGKEVTMEMKQDLCAYVNQLRMEEVHDDTVGKHNLTSSSTTFLKLVDESSFCALHENYKEYFKARDPTKKVIEKYKTFYEHFHRLFPDVQLNKGSKNVAAKQNKNKVKQYSGLDLEVVD